MNMTIMMGRAYALRSYGPQDGKQYTTTYFVLDYSVRDKDGNWTTWQRSCKMFSSCKFQEGDLITVWGEMGKRKDKEGNSKDELTVSGYKLESVPPLRQPRQAQQNIQSGAQQGSRQPQPAGVQPRQQRQAPAQQGQFFGDDSYDTNYGDYGAPF